MFLDLNFGIYFAEGARLQIPCRVDSVAKLNEICGQNSIGGMVLRC